MKSVKKIVSLIFVFVMIFTSVPTAVLTLKGYSVENTAEGECSHENTAIINAVIPTCYDTGLTQGLKCSDCGLVLTEQETVEVLNHNYNNLGICELCGFAGTVLYDGVCSDDISWTLYDDGQFFVYGSGNMLDYTETTIPWNAYLSSIERVVISEGITAVGDYSFYKFQSVKSILLPETLIRIGKNSFYGCYALSGVLSLPTEAEIVDDYAFYQCESLTGELILPESLSYLGESSFENCMGITGDLIIPESITSIPDYCFFGCSGLNGNLILPESIVEIGEHAFEDCSALSGELKLPGSLKSIGSGAFCDCSTLTGDLIIPDSVESIGRNAFDGCSGFNGTLKLSENLKHINTSTFAYCSGLTGTLIIPDSIISINEHAFQSCENIYEVIFGTGLKYIYSGDNMFVGCAQNIRSPFRTCNNITKFTFSGKEPSYINSTIAGSETDFENANFQAEYSPKCFFNLPNLTSVCVPKESYSMYASVYGSAIKATTTLTTESDSDFLIENDVLVAYLGNDVSVTVPQGITEIGAGAFVNKVNIKNIALPETVKSIGKNAFRGCASLSYINLPEELTFIDDYAFYNCKNWSGKLDLPENLTHIGNYAFYYCENLTGKLNLPDTLTYIGKNAFYYCERLTGDLVIPPKTTEISNYAFAYCSGLNGNLVLHDNISVIGDYAFYNCTGLVGDLYIPETEISNYAFAYCSGLNGNLVLHDNISVIGDSAFYSCRGLVGDLCIPGSVTTIGSYAFGYCSGFNGTLTLSESISTIESYTFYGCSGLSGTLVIPDSVTSIDSYAFNNCTSINQVIFGTGLKNLYAYYSKSSSSNSSDTHSYAFKGCSGLSSMVFRGNVPYINNSTTATETNTTYLQNFFSTIYLSGLKTIYTTAQNLQSFKTAWGSYIPSSVKILAYDLSMPVSNLKSVYSTSNSIGMSWSAPPSDEIVGYNIYRNNKLIKSTENCYFDETGLEKNITYEYSVCGYTQAGIESDAATISVTTNTPVVSDIYTDTAGTVTDYKLSIENGLLYVKVKDTGNTDGGQVLLYCKKTDSEAQQEPTLLGEANEQYYKKENGFAVYKFDLNSLSLEKNIPYYIYAEFIDKDGESSNITPSGVSVIIDTSIPQKIASIAAIGDTNKVVLTWSVAAEIDVQGYNIYRKKESESEFSLLTNIGSRETLNFTDITALKDVVYNYYVVAIGVFGDEGIASDIVSASPLYDTELPEITNISPENNTYLNKTATFWITATDNVGVTKCELYYSINDGSEWVLFDSAELDSFSRNLDTTALPDGKIKIKVLAYDEVGNISDGTPVYTYMIDNTAPEKVEGLKAVSVLSTKLTLAWDAPEAKDTAYFILEKKDGSVFSTVSSKIENYLGYNLTNLEPETTYTFRVAAVDSLGNKGAYSDEFSVTTTKDTTSPVVTALSPAPGRYNKTISFKTTATDDFRIESMTIQKSVDAKVWTDVYTHSFTSMYDKTTYTYSMDLSNESEGNLYLRTIVRDSFGNISDDSDAAPYVQYVVDKTAPGAPQSVSAKGLDGMVLLSWKKGTESDLGKYFVYRATQEDGTYTKIASSITTLNYYDETVDRETVYYYKVCVSDTAGNISDPSSVVSAKSVEDTEKPIINSISPSSGSHISNASCTVKVLASDNDILNEITVEYKTGLLSEYQVLKKFSNIGNYYKTVSCSLPVAELSDGDNIYVRAYCSDKAGLISEYSDAVKLEVDKKAPELKKLECVIENAVCTITWNDCGEDDLSGFKVYRSINGGTYTFIGSRSVSSSGKYTFADSVSDGNYIYRIDCIDKTGNIESFYTESQTIIKPVTLIAKITSESYLEENVQYRFSASDSQSSEGIAEYSWNFDDGTESFSATPVKSFASAGEYTVKLTVTDTLGNVSSVQKVITVSERQLLGVAKVTVVDENGNPVANSPVYFDLGEENQQIINTNSKGVASLTMLAGSHTIGVYKNGYLPASDRLIVVTSETSELTLRMVKQELITGEFEVHEMTFEEIVAAGIDTSNPANQQVYQVSVTLKYGDQQVPVSYIRNDKEIISYTIKNQGGTGGGNSDGSGGSGGGGGGNPISNIYYVPNNSNQEIIAVIEAPLSASYLKQFFSATLHIVNNAAPGYKIVDCNANINVPNGLTVVQGSSISSVIDGQQSSSANWILRGDKAGTYDLSASFNGMLEDFNAPVSATFKADGSVTVYGSETVKLRMEVNDEIQYDTLYFNVGLVNQRSVPVNCPNINHVEYVKLVTEAVKNNAEVIDGDKHECELLNIRVDHGDGTCTYYEPDSTSEELSKILNTLPAGAGLFYEYVVYDLIDYDGIAYFNDAAVDCAKEYYDTIEVVSVSMDKFSETNYDAMFSHLKDDEHAVLVIDSSGNPIVNAKVKYGDKEKRTDKKGVAQFKKIEEENYEIVVSKFGYRTCYNSFNGEKFSHDKYDIITLYSNDESVYSLKKCNYIYGSLSYDILSANKRISSTNSGIFSITCEALETAKVERYELWQSGKVLALSDSGVFENLSPKEIAPGKGFGINVVPSNGDEPVMTSINFEIVEDKKVKATALKFNHKKTQFSIDHDVPFIGGTTVDADILSDFIPLDIYVGGDKVYVGVNLSLTEDPQKTHKEKMEEYKKDIAMLKQYAPMDVNDISLKCLKGGFPLSTPATPDIEAALVGYGEGTITDGRCSELTLNIFLTVKAKVSKTWYYVAVVPFLSVPAPFYVDIEGSIKGKFGGKIGYDIYNEQAVYNLELEFTPGLKAVGAVGLKPILSAGAYGSATLPIKFSLADSSTDAVDYVDLTGELGLHATVVGGTIKVPFIYKTWHLYTSNPKVKSRSLQQSSDENYMMQLYDISNYTADDLTYKMQDDADITVFSNHSISKTVNNNFIPLAENSYTAASPSIAVNSEKTVMAYIDVDNEKPEQNATEVMFSVYNSDLGTWDSPKFVYHDEYAKYSPKLTAIDDTIYLTYQKRTSTLKMDEMSTREYYSNIELEVAKFNSETESFEVLGSVKPENCYSTAAELCLDNGNLAMVWLANAEDDPLGMQGGKILKSVYENGSWGEYETLVITDKSISAFAVSDNANDIMYSVGNDESYLTNNCILYHLSSSGTQTKLHEGDVYAIKYARIPGHEESGYIWNSSGVLLYSIDGKTCESLFNEETLFSVSNEFTVVEDSVIFVDSSENNTDVYIAKMTENGFKNATQLSREDQYVENLTAVKTEDGIHMLSLLTDVTITEDEVKKQSKLAWSMCDEITDLEVLRVDYDFEAVTASEMLVSDVCVHNNGTRPITEIQFVVSCGDEVVNTQTVSTNILSGESGVLNVDIHMPEKVTLSDYTIKGIVAGDVNAENNSNSFKIGYTDLSADSIVLQKKEKTALLVDVTNNTGVVTGGTLNVYADNSEIPLKSIEIDELGKNESSLYEIDIAPEALKGSNAGLIKAVIETTETDYCDDNNSTEQYISFAEHGLVEKVEIDSDNVEMVVGETHQLSAAVSPDGFTVDKTVFWESGDELVATIDHTGVITATGVGTTTISVRTADGGITDTCEIEVICSEHSYGDWGILKDSTCTEIGEKTRICSVCNRSETVEIGLKEHTYSSVVTVPTCTEGGYTSYTCSCGDRYVSDKTDALGHKGGNANCAEQAICLVCGELYDGLNAENHKSVVIDEAVAPSCTQTGLTEGSHCEACNKVIVAQIVVEKLNHTASDWITDKESTCIAEGTKHTECIVCKEVLKNEVTAKKEHNYNSVVTAPTCIEGGYTTYTCSCGESYISDRKPANGHSFGEWSVSVEATLNLAEKMERICSVCKVKEEKTYVLEPITFEIRTPSITSINYGDSIVLHADVDLPTGAKVVWESDNGNFTKNISADGKTCTISPDKTGDTVFTAKIVDSNGNLLAEPKTQKMTSNAGFFKKVLAFFKKIFGMTKIIPQAFKSVI